MKYGFAKFALVLALTLGLAGSLLAGETSNRFPFGGVRTATITATETLTGGGSATVQKLNPSTASRSVVLPSEADSQGLFYILVNTGTTYDLNVKASDGTTAVITVTPGFSAMVVCDGTTWYTGGASSASTATLSVGAIAASDSSLDITGQAGSGGGAGGSVNRTAGAGHTNGAGGTITDTGGAGAGTGAGGALARVGGASGSGATGNGGAVSNTGGAALSTNGNGGAASMTGGVATGTGTGGAVTLTSGASGGAGGTAGSITIDAGDEASGTRGTISIGGAEAGTVTVGRSGQILSLPGTVQRTSQRYCYGIAGAKVGATAGWVVNAAADFPAATCPASQTAATLVIPIGNLKSGTIITGFGLCGQIESAGGAVTVDCALRKCTTAAGDFVDASVSTMTQISVTADTAIDSTQDKTGLSVTVAQTEVYYMLVTVTTAGSTDVDLRGIRLVVTEQ